MKKTLVRVALVLVLLVVAGGIGLVLVLDKAIKRGVETVGPMITQVDVKVGKVQLSLLSGSGALEGLVVGNPRGYQTPHAIKIDRAALALRPRSLLGDKVVIKSINIQGPEITFEGDLAGNNLSQIQKNVDAFSGGGSAATPEAQEEATTKLQVDEVVVAGGKINVSSRLLGGKTLTLNLPELRLSQLGQGPDGITAADLTRRLLSSVNKESLALVGKELVRFGGQAVDGAMENARQTLEEAKRNPSGISELLKKKK